MHGSFIIRSVLISLSIALHFGCAQHQIFEQPQKYELLQKALHGQSEEYLKQLEGANEFIRGLHSLINGAPTGPKENEFLKRSNTEMEIQRNPSQELESLESEQTKKREISQAALPPHKCVNGGYPTTAWTEDPCQGKQCHITLIKCGTYVFSRTNWTAASHLPLINCTVLKVDCQEGKITTQVELLESSNCLPSYFRCGRTNQKPSAVGTNNYWGCSPQLVCNGSDIYGTDTWGYRCITQSIECNPNNTDCKIVDSLCPQTECKPNNTDCKIVDSLCPQTGDITKTTCTSIYATCGGGLPGVWNILDNLCSSHQRKESSCIPKVIKCQGNEILDAKYFRGNLALCESILEVECDSQQRVRFPSQFCRIVELNCNGKTVAFTNQARLDAGCSIQTIVCSNATSILTDPKVGCDIHRFSVPSCTGLTFTNTTAPCLTFCQDKKPTQFCHCPMDKKGQMCELDRKFSCSVSMLSPIAKCKYIKRSGDDQCYEIKFRDLVDIKFSFSCQFLDEGLPYVKFNYKYGIVTKTWSLTETPSGWSIAIKLLNMISLGSPNTTRIELNNKNIIDGEPVPFRLKPTELNPELRMGNRIQIQITPSLPIPNRIIDAPITRFVFDIIDLPGPAEPTFWELYGSTIITTITLVSIVLIILIIAAIKRSSQKVSNVKQKDL